MAGVYWYNGQWTTEEPKVIGPMDHAFWLGSVIFDGGRSFGGVAPDLDLHSARCLQSARNMLMKPTMTAAEIEALCREGIRRMGMLVVDRGRLELVQPLIVIPAIVLQRLQSDPTFRGVEPAPWEHHPGRVDLLFDRQIRTDLKVNP